MNMFKPVSAKNPRDYIAQIDEPRKSDIKNIHKFIRKTLPELDQKIFHNIIGYGKYHYKAKSSKKASEWFTVGLASQKNYISIYVCSLTDDNEYLAEKHKEWFPKASIGKSCIRFKKYEDIDFKNLEKLLKLAKKFGPMGKV